MTVPGKFQQLVKCFLASSTLLVSFSVAADTSNTGSDQALMASGMWRDPATGLIWDRCSLGQKWDGSTCEGEAQQYSWQEAVTAAKRHRLGDHSDWQLPTVSELGSIHLCTAGVDLSSSLSEWDFIPGNAKKMKINTGRFCNPGSNSPAIDAVLFPNTSDSWYWTSSQTEGESWYVLFYPAMTYGRDFSKKTHFVRAVRSTQSLGNEALVKVFQAKLQPVEGKSVPAPKTLSRCEVNGNGTFTGADGTIWQACLYGQSWKNGECHGSSKNVSWYEAMDAAKRSTFAGKSDWVLPSSSFLNGSIHPETCRHPNISMTASAPYFNAPKQLKVVGHYWTANTGSRDGGGTVDITDSGYVFGYNSVFFDTLKSASDFDKGYQSIYAVFVRNASASDSEKFAKALTLTKCDAQCLASRRKAQGERDQGSVRRGEEFNAQMRGFFGSTSTGSSAPNTNSSNGKSWTIERTRKERGVSWHSEITIKCTSGPKSGESYAILALDNGRFQSLTGPTESSLDKVAQFHCNQ